MRPLVAGLVVAALLPLVPVAEAAPVVPFTPRFQVNDSGGIFVVGNNLLTCPASDTACSNSQSGGKGSKNNNGFDMVEVDADQVATTRSSSSAQLALPPSSEVLWAGLYWGARLQAGPRGEPAVGDGRTLSFRGPADGAYNTVTASTLFGPTATADRAYQGFVEVTDLVRAQGNGAYWAGDLAAGTGEDRYGGWSLAVVFRNASLPLRNLTVFDGLTDVGRGEPQTIDVAGFLAPVSGPVQTEVRMVAYEGDFTTSGDTAQLESTQLGTSLSPGSNFFNGSNDLNGASLPARSPAHRNMLGFDIKRLGVPGAIPNSATSATISLESSGDRYLPGMVATQIDLYAPDFSTSTKSAVALGGNDPARVGDVVQYALTYSNTGQDPALEAVVEDPLPPGTEYVPGSLEITAGASAGPLTDAASDDQGEIEDGVVRVRLGTGASATSGGSIGIGESTTVTFQARLLAASAGTTVANRADLVYEAATLQQEYTFRAPATATPVAARADLAISKVTTPDPALAGETVTSTLTVTNAGPNSAPSVEVVDTLPDGLSFENATSTQGVCNPAPKGPVCQVGDLPAGASVTVSVSASIPPGSTASNLVNLASVTSPVDDPDPSNNSTGSSVRVGRAADLSVTKAVSQASVTPGGLLTYSMTATNAGPSDAANVVITDVAPVGELALLEASAPGALCTVSAEVARCTVPTLQAGESATMTVEAIVAQAASAGLVLNNSVQVTSDTADPEPTNNQAGAAVTITDPESDLRVSKSQIGGAFAGGDVTYTVSVINAGPSLAQDVVLTDPLPPGFIATSATSSRGTCVLGPPVSCEIGELLAPVGGGPPGSARITIRATIDPDLRPSSTVNAASASSMSIDPTPDDATGRVTTDVLAVADLSVAKSAVPQQPAAGDDVTFTVTVTNQGPSTARDVQLTDVLPAGLTLVSTTPPSGASCTGNPLVCDLGDLVTGSSVELSVVMNVPPDADLDALLIQAASATSSTPDPSDANNSASVTITSRAISDLITLKFINSPFEDPVPLTAGTQVTYQLAVGNLGPSDATTARVVDVLPPGATFVSSVPQCSHSNQVVTCDLPTVPDQFAAVFPITVQLADDLDPGTQLTNSALVTLLDPSRVDPVSSNNVAVLTNPVVASSDVSVTKDTFVFSFATNDFIIPAEGPAGSPAGAQITVRNDGPSVARNVVIDDVATLGQFSATQILLIKPGQEPEDITAACNLANGEVQCPIGDMPVFDPADPGWGLQVNGAITSDAAPGTYTNAATVSSSTPDADGGNNESSSPVTVTAPVTTLAIDKTSLQGDTLAAGESFGYRLEVTNEFVPSLSAASDAPDVVVTDTLPPGFTPTAATSSQGACSITLPSTVTCQLGTVLGPIRLDEPPPVIITITGTVASNVAGIVTNTATVTSPVSEPATDTLDTEVIQQIDVFLEKSANSDPFVAGSVASWTLIVGNAGPSDATLVEAGELLPPDVTFLPDASSPGCVEDLAVSFVTCPIGTLAAGDTVAIVIAVQTSADTSATELVNRAIASSQRVSDEVDFSNNEVTVTTPLVRRADLSVIKVSDSPTPSVGTSFQYTLGVTNAGPSTASEVVVADSLPSGLVARSVQTAEGLLDCELVGSAVSCTAASFPSGVSESVTIVVDIPDGSLPGPVENTATVTSATGDSDLRNNSSTTTVDVGVVADVSIDKSLETTPVVSGQPATFRLSVTNAGPATAPDVTTSDTLPPGTVFVSAEAALGCVSDRQEGLVVVTCSLGALAPGDTASSTLTLLAPTTGALTNVGSAGSGALDPCPEDGVCAAGDDRGNVDSVTFEVVNRPPVATDDLDVLAVSGVPLTIDVLANDFEPDGEPLEVVAVGAPQAGSAELGSVIYTSDSEYIGTDQFTYTVCDPGGLCDEGLVTLTIVAAPTEAQPPPGTSDPPSERGETFGGGQQGALAATGLPLTTWIGLGVLFLAGGILVRWASVPGRARLDRSRRRDRREIRCGA